MEDEPTLDLEPGDFLYQTDRERFLVVMEDRGDSYLFSVHGWREIGKERATGYVEEPHGSLHTQEQFEEVIDQEADEDTAANYEKLKEMFQKYSEDLDTDVSDQFSMEDQQ